MLTICIRKCLWAGGILLVVIVTALVLWATLARLGDRAGGQGAKGVALVAGVCWGLDFITLVVLLALKQLATDGTVSDDAVFTNAVSDGRDQREE